MRKIYMIFRGNKSGTQLVVVPKGYEGFTIGTKVEFEFENGKLSIVPVKEARAEPAPATP